MLTSFFLSIKTYYNHRSDPQHYSSDTPKKDFICQLAWHSSSQQCLFGATRLNFSFFSRKNVTCPTFEVANWYRNSYITSGKKGSPSDTQRSSWKFNPSWKIQHVSDFWVNKYGWYVTVFFLVPFLPVLPDEYFMARCCVRVHVQICTHARNGDFYTSKEFTINRICLTAVCRESRKPFLREMACRWAWWTVFCLMWWIFLYLWWKFKFKGFYKNYEKFWCFDNLSTSSFEFDKMAT